MDALGALRALGHDRFRPGQREAVDALLDGRDVQVLLPTGGGKSGCYQVPALALHAAGKGPTLVVSPLVALMDDQVAALRARGIAAVALHRSTPWRTRDRVLADPSSQVLVYASPERLSSAAVRRKLAGRVARVAVDEAHCI
ncbi:MAG: DEAD/DEAH box helicase, partial [Myxococcales bacterium]|nr:DEAD/DEAH box helicase [Myxococcales bacterium]